MLESSATRTAKRGSSASTELGTDKKGGHGYGLEIGQRLHHDAQSGDAHHQGRKACNSHGGQAGSREEEDKGKPDENDIDHRMAER